MRGIGMTLATIIAASLATSARADVVTVLGMPLGQQFTVAACPMKKGVPDFSQTCYTLPFPSDTDIKQIWYSGDPVIGHTIKAYVHGGILDSLTFETLGLSNQDYVMQKLIEKFGKPDQFEKEPMQNLAGAQFLVYRAEWNKPDVYVRFDADSGEGDLNAGWVKIESGKYHAEFVKRREQYLKDHPSKL